MRAGPAGECYRNVVQYASQHPAATVVHGTVKFLSGKRGGHAWVEEGAFVVDPTTGVRVAKKRYYKLLAARPVARYDSTRALVLAVRHGHWGPWD